MSEQQVPWVEWAVDLTPEVEALTRDLERYKMMHRVAEDQLNDYIVRTREAERSERRLREALSLTRCVLGSRTLAPVLKEIDAALAGQPDTTSAITRDELHCLKQIQHFLEGQYGYSHQGYYSGQGWVGRTLDELIQKLEKTVKS